MKNAINHHIYVDFNFKFLQKKGQVNHSIKYLVREKKTYWDKLCIQLNIII